MDIPMLKILTEADCLEGILKAQNSLDSASDNVVARKAQARKAIWERLMDHVREGRTVTLSMDERMHLWDDVSGNA
jgi:hypothetical protein